MVQNRKTAGAVRYPLSYEVWRKVPTKENAAVLLNDLKPVIEGAVKSYGAGDPTLRTRAKILAMQAVKGYDPSRGTQLNTYMMGQMQSLNRIARQRRTMSHVPENVYLNRRALEQAAAEYREKYGRDPSDKSLADMTGITVNQIKRSRQGQATLPQSRSISDKGDTTIEAPRDYLDVWTDYVYNDLDDIDRKIFEGVSGYNGAPIRSKKDIAKELKLSPAAVSYRVGKITSKLEEMPTNEVG